MDVERLRAAEESLAFVVARAECGLRLDRLLAARLPFASRTRAAGWIRAGRAQVDGEVVSRAAAPASAGQRRDPRLQHPPRDAAPSPPDPTSPPPLAPGAR